MRHSIWLAAVSALALAACNEPAVPTPYDTDDAASAAAPEEPATNTVNPAPAGTGEAEPAPAMAAFTVTDAWIRNPPPGRDVTAGFMTLTAEGAAARLVDARSLAAARMEIHTMAMEGDVMRMRQVGGFDIPEGGSITLAPGGDHLMMFEINRDILATGQVEVELVFENGQTVNQVFEVRDTAPDAAAN